VIIAIVIIAVAYLFFHVGHSHANYRHGRAHGRRGVNLYWSSIRGPWISVPGLRNADRAPLVDPRPPRQDALPLPAGGTGRLGSQSAAALQYGRLPRRWAPPRQSV